MAVESRRDGMAAAQIPVLLTQKPSTENGITRATTLFLAWVAVLVVPVGYLDMGDQMSCYSRMTHHFEAHKPGFTFPAIMSKIPRYA